MLSKDGILGSLHCGVVWTLRSDAPPSSTTPPGSPKGIITPFSRPCLRKRAKTLRDGGSQPESLQTQPVAVRAGLQTPGNHFSCRHFPPLSPLRAALCIPDLSTGEYYLPLDPHKLDSITQSGKLYMKDSLSAYGSRLFEKAILTLTQSSKQLDQQYRGKI